jgi:carbonic anhydrase/acetyltransferase-like protein (isoleucine patch superfamily)
MTVSSFEGRTPTIGEGCWVHPSADVFGAVRLGARCWIGPGARLRGDYGTVVLGDCCAVEDNCVVHARPDETCTIGSWVTLGHACVVHNARAIGDYAVVGMGAVVSDWAELGEWAVVAEGAVVPQRAVVPAARIAAGVPARLLDRAIDEEHMAAWRGFKERYVELCERYRSGFVP